MILYNHADLFFAAVREQSEALSRVGTELSAQCPLPPFKNPLFFPSNWRYSNGSYSFPSAEASNDNSCSGALAPRGDGGLAS